jgi:predicted nucleic acid-binding Zn ribbon protein
MGRKRGPRAGKNKAGRNWKHIMWMIVGILIAVSMVASLFMMAPMF